MASPDSSEGPGSSSGAAHGLSSGPGSGVLGEPLSAWVALLVGVLAVSAHSAFSFGMAPLMKPILADLGWTRTQWASAVNLRLLVLIVASPFAGQLADRLGPRLVLTMGAVIVGTAILGLARIHTLAELMALSVWAGPGQACIGSVAASVLVLRRFRRRQGLAIGILNGGDNLINAGIPVGTAMVLAASGWRAAVNLLGVAYLVLAVLIVLALRPTSDEAQTPNGERAGDPAAGRRATWRDVPWRDASMWLLLTVYVVIYAFITSVALHFQAFLSDQGLTPEEAARVYATSTLVGAFGSPLFGWLAERIRPRTLLAGVLLGLLATSLPLWLVHGPHGFWLWAVVYGVINAGSVVLLALVMRELYGAHAIGTLLGVAMVFCMSGTVIGNQASAAVFDATGSYVQMWRLYSALLAAALVPVEILRRRHGSASSGMRAPA